MSACDSIEIPSTYNNQAWKQLVQRSAHGSARMIPAYNYPSAQRTAYKGVSMEITILTYCAK